MMYRYRAEKMWIVVTQIDGFIVGDVPLCIARGTVDNYPLHLIAIGSCVGQLRENMTGQPVLCVVHEVPLTQEDISRYGYAPETFYQVDAVAVNGRL